MPSRSSVAPSPSAASGNSAVRPHEIEAHKQRGASYEKTLPSPRLVPVIDFFSGCGGLSTGLKSVRTSGAAFDVLAGIDIDRRALATYELNGLATPVRFDISELATDPDRLLDLVPAFDPAARPFVFVACPPCQGFSAHRKKDVRDDLRNSLITAFALVAAHFLPDVIAIENVPEMLKGRYEGYYREAREILVSAGYSITEGVHDLSLFGVPQRRRRALVLASRLGAIEPPTPVLSRDEVRTVRDAIAHLPPHHAGDTDPTDPWHRSPKHVERILRKIEQIPPDGGDRRHLDRDEQLDCHRDIDDRATSGFTDVYGRLRWDAPAVTITAKSSTPSCGRFLHPEQHRNISVREAALLQSFPHNFVFAGPFVNQYRQVGEAVPPLFGRHLGLAILDHLSSGRGATNYQRVAKRVASAGTQAPHRSRRPSLVSVDLFCGAGGLSLGLDAAGIPSVIAVDTDADAIATFSKNVAAHGVVASVLDDDLPSKIDAAVAGRRFVVVGGPPCQGFSQQRRGHDADVRNNLVVAYADLISALANRPEAVVLENVMYLDSPRGRAVLSEFVTKLAALGYSVHRHDLNSADFGVPQLRRRIVLVCVRRDSPHQYVPPKALTPKRWPTIGDALAGLTTLADDRVPNHVAAAERPINVRRMAFVDMGRGRTAIPRELQLDCHREYDGHLDVYGRLDWFSQARTITGGFDSSSRGEYTHPFRNRSLTAREAARVQGFPDWFEFLGNKAAVRRQIGNAVPPPLGYAIGVSLNQSLVQRG
jgi:DNA (cytosine-5)-methyltransferase 1